MKQRALSLVSLVILALATSSGRGQQPSDSELFAQGRIALDKYNDCPSAKRSFEAESANAQDSAVWLDYAARASECAGYLEAALGYYEKESKRLPGSARLIDKVGDLRYRIAVQKDENARQATQRAEQNAQQAALQSANGPSLVETIAYINSHAPAPTDDHGRPDGEKAIVSFSMETNLLLIQKTSWNYCGAGCTGTHYFSIPIRFASMLDVTSSGDRISLSCSQYSQITVKCIHVRNLMPRNSNKQFRDRQDDIYSVAVLDFDNAEQGDRLAHAFKRLMVLLDQRYQAQNLTDRANDPFR